MQTHTVKKGVWLVRHAHFIVLQRLSSDEVENNEVSAIVFIHHSHTFLYIPWDTHGAA